MRMLYELHPHLPVILCEQTCISYSFVSKEYTWLYIFKMFEIIQSLAACKIWSVKGFLLQKNISVADTLWHIAEIYGAKAMAEGKVQRWFREFNGSCENVHGEECSSRQVQDYGNRVRRLVQCFAGRLYATRKMINTDTNHTTLKKLRKTIQNKRRGIISKGILLHHNNTTRRTSDKTWDLIKWLGWNILDHPLYSADLVPRDFHLF